MKIRFMINPFNHTLFLLRNNNWASVELNSPVKCESETLFDN